MNFSDDPEDRASAKVLSDLENIDDELDQEGIVLVKRENVISFLLLDLVVFVWNLVSKAVKFGHYFVGENVQRSKLDRSGFAEFARPRFVRGSSSLDFRR